MEQLTHLLNKHNWTRNAVRIVRYEEFYQPSIVCKKLFDFVFRHTSMSMMGHDGDKVAYLF
ncbi:hypothetical protein EON65_23145 [archaeon]|nr:MAG: hypothetical protein EON65_23145 [archaeon]